MTADEIIEELALKPHPEGGHYRETWVAAAEAGARPTGTCIYFLLRRGEHSHWHRVDAAEIWHFYAGEPLILAIAESDKGPARDHILGPDLSAGQRPQLVVPPGHWQMARPAGGWTLAGCTVSPGFQFARFTLAPPDFDIPREG